MAKRIVFFLSGSVIGAGLVWALCVVPGAGSVSAPSGAAAPAVAPAVSLSCDSETSPLRQKVRELEGQVAALSSSASATAEKPETTRLEEPVEVDQEAEQQRQQEAARWRVSAIEKFVPLTAGQRDRLSEKFRREAESGDEAGAESLEEILGQENADYYRQQVKAAFQRVQDQETEKEIVWMSRQLSLSADQERAVKGVYAGVEQQVRQEFGSQQHGGTPRSAQERVTLMILESRRRTELRNTQMKAVLSPEQYEAFLKNEAESASADVEVFHDPGE